MNDPFLVSEQLGFDQLFGNRRTVHLHEALAASQAVAMDGARDQLLPDAALALDEHGGVGGRRSCHSGHHQLQRTALADHLMPDLDRLLQGPVLVPETALIESVAQTDEHSLAGKRLLDEIERALFRGFDRGANRKP